MDFINIIGTFFDNSIEHVVALAHLIKDLRLNKNQQDINEDVYNEINSLKEKDETIKLDISLLKEEDLKIYNRITFIEEDLESVHQEFLNFNTEIDENIDSINEHILNIDRDNEDLNQRVTYIEENGLPEFKDGLKHKLISKREYDALESYDRNTLYVIVDFNENTSVFGDTFPLILGGDVANASHFGDNFPLIFN